MALVVVLCIVMIAALSQIKTLEQALTQANNITIPPAKCTSQVTCYCKDTGTEMHNNIQASHIANSDTYILPKNNNNMGCFRFDEFGKVYGSSMQPTYFEGNTVFLINYTNKTKLHSGDLVRYIRFNEKYPDCESIKNDKTTSSSLGGSWLNNTYVVIHRINAIYGDILLMQGDNLYEQEDIEKCQVTDVVVGVLYT